MLKITPLSRKGRKLTIKIEGEILEPWVDTVRDACAIPGSRSGNPCLDLAAVTYVDAAGARLLRDLMHRGFQIGACSGFVGELLGCRPGVER